MSIDSIDVADDYRSVEITSTVTNQSDEVLRIHVLDTGLRISGRSLTASEERYNDRFLAPDESATLVTTLPIQPSDVGYLRERLATPGQVWNINGRLSVSIEDLSEPVWVPFRFDLGAS